MSTVIHQVNNVGLLGIFKFLICTKFSQLNQWLITHVEIIGRNLLNILFNAIHGYKHIHPSIMTAGLKKN